MDKIIAYYMPQPGAFPVWDAHRPWFDPTAYSLTIRTDDPERYGDDYLNEGHGAYYFTCDRERFIQISTMDGVETEASAYGYVH
jgi:hypothetical protein